MGWQWVDNWVFEHNEDKCPSDCGGHSDGTCVGYAGSGDQYVCPGHRNVNKDRDVDFQVYNVGTIIEHPQINTISSILQKEIDERHGHSWYTGLMDTTDVSVVNRSDLILHEQENKINDVIEALNSMINSYTDYGLGVKDGNLSSKAVVSGDYACAEDLKKLEFNILNAVRDCICYSDCTGHGYYNHPVLIWVPDEDSGKY